MNDAKLHELYVDAISGIDMHLFSIEQSSELEKEGLAKYVGNGHAVIWDWNREALTRLNLLQLEQTYMMLKALQASKTEPVV
jgi:hypothetical protein